MVNSSKKENEFWGISFAVFLVALIAGNGLYHLQILHISNQTLVQSLLKALNVELFNGSIIDTLKKIIYLAKGDIFCLLTIASARFLKKPSALTFLVFLYRGIIFGFCGAGIIGALRVETNWRPFFGLWLAFFVYHVILFSSLLHFAVYTLRIEASSVQNTNFFRYFMTICEELSLIIFLNVIYYFLIYLIR